MCLIRVAHFFILLVKHFSRDSAWKMSGQIYCLYEYIPVSIVSHWTLILLAYEKNECSIRPNQIYLLCLVKTELKFSYIFLIPLLGIICKRKWFVMSIY